MSATPPYASPYPVPPGFTFGQVLDRIFKLFRTHVLFFIRLGLLPAGAMLVIYAAVFGVLFHAGFFTTPGKPPDMRELLVFFVAGAVGSLGFMYVYALYEAAACHAALRANDGFAIAVRESFRAVIDRSGRIVWLMIIRTLIVVVPGMIGAGLIAGATALALHGGSSPSVLAFFPFLMFLLYLGWIVYLVFAMLRLALAVPACLAEELPATEALKRSLQLTRHAKGRVFLVLLVVYAATSVGIFLMEILIVVVAMIGMLLAMAFHLQFSPPWSYVGLGLAAVCGAGVFLIFMMATWALYAITMVVLYHDQRLRLEGSPPPLAGEPA